MSNSKKVTPDDLKYKDRGIVKWLGMMLSDHSEALKKESQDSRKREVKAKAEMTDTEISNILFQSFTYHYPVRIQANILKNGYYYQDLKCKVSGYADNRIYLQLKDGRSVNCMIEEIRNAEIMRVEEWYEGE
ncbi:hypothetical protein [Corticicoccus populi]|uniref:YolD-like family protein n=1 Tax=Corticicoccus populi TaxID=1812821 RepID=A0ABW5WWN4_9STAP